LYLCSNSCYNNLVETNDFAVIMQAHLQSKRSWHSVDGRIIIPVTSYPSRE
jgi:hypothetical protein